MLPGKKRKKDEGKDEGSALIFGLITLRGLDVSQEQLDVPE